MKDSLDLTVVICCYNSASRLPRTLSHLVKQHNIDGLNWELLIINNNSPDDTSSVAAKVWQELKTAVPLRIVDEPKAGITAARKTGVIEAKGEFILFCDDDNHLSSNYFHEAIRTIRQDSAIAVVAGNGQPAWIAPPPPWIDHCLSFLACKPQTTVKQDAGVTGFYSAGMLARRQALMEVYQTFDLALSSRSGTKKLGGGEDLELCLLLSILGYRLWGNPLLTFGHEIAVERLNWRYIKSLRFATGVSNAQLAPIKFVAQQKEKNYKSKWAVQLLATMFRVLGFGTRYPFSKHHAMEFWHQLGRAKGLLFLRKSYNTRINHLAAIRENSKQRNVTAVK